MQNKRLLVLLSILVVLLGIAATVWFTPEYFSALGSLFAAVGGILAVIWFSASLYYQSRQLKEQREQFSENFRQLREDARRNALTLAKDILTQAEEKALKLNPALKSIADLPSIYLDFHEWKILLESDNPELVLEAGKSWIAKEGPATFLMRGIKNAAETYFMAIGRSDIDYSKEPEEFVYIYGPALWTLPYFGDYQGVATLLSEQMFIMKPGRKTVLLAGSIAMARSLPEEWTRKDKIIQNMEEHKKAGYRLPAIAQNFK